MRGLLVGAAIAAAVLLPAAPATTGSTAPGVDRADVSLPSPRPTLPGLPDRPDEGCTVPVASLEACPRPDRRQPPVSCVLPVGGPGVLLPDCPPRDPSPEGRVLPVLPLTP